MESKKGKWLTEEAESFLDAAHIAAGSCKKHATVSALILALERRGFTQAEVLLGAAAYVDFTLDEAEKAVDKMADEEDAPPVTKTVQ